MESLFLDTVNRLASRVIELEKSQQRFQQQQQQQQPPPQPQSGRNRTGSASHLGNIMSSSSGNNNQMNGNGGGGRGNDDDRLPPIPRGSFNGAFMSAVSPIFPSSFSPFVLPSLPPSLMINYSPYHIDSSSVVITIYHPINPLPHPFIPPLTQSLLPLPTYPLLSHFNLGFE